MRLYAVDDEKLLKLPSKKLKASKRHLKYISIATMQRGVKISLFDK